MEEKQSSLKRMSLSRIVLLGLLRELWPGSKRPGWRLVGLLLPRGLLLRLRYVRKLFIIKESKNVMNFWGDGEA